MFCAGTDKVCKLFQLISRFMVIGFDIIRTRPGNQNDFLTQVIKCNHFIKQH